MELVFLSDKFYKDYKDCKEIEQKPFRPYIMLLISINNLLFAIPMRSHITHKHAYFTDSVNRCGVDFTKAVIINNKEYIIKNKVPIIRPHEYLKLVKSNDIIFKKFSRYLKGYIKAVKANAIETLQSYTYKYTTLCYFHKELGLVQE